MAASDPRIAFVVPRYGPDVVGGAETLCRLVAENLALHGLTVDVLTTCAVDHFTWQNVLPESEERVGGVNVRRFLVSSRRDNARWLDLHVRLDLQQDIGYAGELEWMANSVWSPGLQRALEDRRRYDWIIPIPYLFGTTYWAAMGRPERCAPMPCVHDETYAWTSVIRGMLGSVRGCLLNSAGESELFSRLAPNGTWRLGGVGYHAVDVPPQAAVDDFCLARGIEPGYLLYAGRREVAKGVPYMFDCYARYRELHPAAPPLALMGSGDLPVPEEIADHVIDLGFVAAGDMAAAYAGAAVFIHPSQLESLGMVLLEAWLAGTPALVNGYSDVLRGHCRESGGGLWFESPDEFVAALEVMLEDAVLRSEMARAGRGYVLREFSWDAVRHRIVSALNEWS